MSLHLCSCSFPCYFFFFLLQTCSLALSALQCAEYLPSLSALLLFSCLFTSLSSPEYLRISSYARTISCPFTLYSSTALKLVFVKSSALLQCLCIPVFKKANTTNTQLFTLPVVSSLSYFLTFLKMAFTLLVYITFLRLL